MGNVFLVCPHHKVLTTALDLIRSWRAPRPSIQVLTTAPPPPFSAQVLDLIRSWRAPNLSTLQGMAPVHASKAARRGLRLDHLFNQREGPQGAIARLETDLADYWGNLITSLMTSLITGGCTRPPRISPRQRPKACKCSPRRPSSHRCTRPSEPLRGNAAGARALQYEDPGAVDCH